MSGERERSRAADIMLDEVLLATLQKEIGKCEGCTPPDTSPEALLIAWVMMHYAEIVAAQIQPELPATVLALSLAESMLRMRDEAIELIKPHVQGMQ